MKEKFAYRWAFLWLATFSALSIVGIYVRFMSAESLLIKFVTLVAGAVAVYGHILICALISDSIQNRYQVDAVLTFGIIMIASYAVLMAATSMSG